MTGPVWPSPGLPAAGGQWLNGTFVVGDVVMVSGVGGNVTITTDRPPYRVEALPTVVETVSVEQARQRPSRLLLAHHQVVPFTGRDGDLQALAGWMGRPAGLSVRLLYAAGGQGKTRLAGHMAQVCAEAGWTVWRVLHEPVFSGGYRMDLPAGGGLLVVVDYADRWPVSHLLSLVTHLKSVNLQTGVAVRVLLLARSTTAWWPALRSRLGSAHLVEATAQPLLALGEQIDRDVLYRQARHWFATAMNVADIDSLPLPTNLADDAFSQILAVHMSALVAVDAHRRDTTAPTRPHALSSYLLLREHDHWHALHHRAAEPRKTSPEVMGRAVYLATLTAAVPRRTAGMLLEQVGLTEPGVTTIIDDHRFCYPPDDLRNVLQALHPDRLGEDLIALSTPGHPYTDDDDAWTCDDWAATVAEVLLAHPDTQSQAWAANAITVLVETARRWPHIATQVLYPLLRKRPDLAVAAGAGSLIRLTELSNVDLVTLEAIEPLLPDRHIDLDVAAAAITAILTPHRVAVAGSVAERASLYGTHALRLSHVGRYREALAPAQEAVSLNRELVEADSAVYLPDLAGSLANLGHYLSEVGRGTDALESVQEAVAIFRELATAGYLPGLARALNLLAALLYEAAREEEALPALQDVVNMYRELTRAYPEAYQADLAGALNGLAAALSKLGQHEKALTLAEEAIAIRRRLAEADPAVYLPDLAKSLHNHGPFLSNVGRGEEAVAPAEEVVAIRRRLAEANPGAYLPDLEISLRSFADLLAETGRREEALAPAEEAATVGRRLAEANPTAHMHSLTSSLVL